MNGIDLVHLIAQTIYSKKGFNVMALDVNNVSTMTDYFIIAEGNVDRHLKSILDAIDEELRKVGEKPIGMETSSGDWMVLDYGNVVIHLFLPEVRERYRIERIWSAGALIDVRDESESTHAAGE
jgi:ribosome-associated protein